MKSIGIGSSSRREENWQQQGGYSGLLHQELDQEQYVSAHSTPSDHAISSAPSCLGIIWSRV